MKALSRLGQNLYLLCGSSCTTEMLKKVERILDGQKLDLLFIDGDHTYEGVKQDFLLYKHLVREDGIIMFHDIVPDHKTRYGRETTSWAGRVPLLWDRLKNFYTHQEFVHDSEQSGFGLGILQYPEAVVLPEDFVNSQDDLNAYPNIKRVKTC